MAIVKCPALSFDASGTVGCINYTRYRGRNIARTTYSYIDPNTTPQQTSRALVTTVSQYWGGTCTFTQRQTWVDRARSVIVTDRLGTKYNPSGYQLFLKWNLQLLQAGGAIMASAPVGNEATDIYEMTAMSSGMPSEMMISLYKQGFAQIDAFALVIFRAGPFSSGGRRPIEPEYRKVAVQSPPSTYTDVGLDLMKFYWWKAFGVFASGIRTTAWDVQAKVEI